MLPQFSGIFNDVVDKLLMFRTSWLHTKSGTGEIKNTESQLWTKSHMNCTIYKPVDDSIRPKGMVV